MNIDTSLDQIVLDKINIIQQQTNRGFGCEINYNNVSFMDGKYECSYFR